MREVNEDNLLRMRYSAEVREGGKVADLDDYR
jgi:hypothetical protein